MNYLKSFYISSSSISIQLDKNNHNYFQYISKDNIIYSYPTYFDNDKISAEIELNLNNNKSIMLDSLTIYNFPRKYSNFRQWKATEYYQQNY